MTFASLVPSLQLGAAAFVIGLSGAMAPGPFLTVVIAETVRKGRLAAMLMLVGHALLEAALLIGFAFGLHNFLRTPVVATGLALAGGAFLLWMGGDLLTGALRGTIALSTEDTGAPLRFGPVLQGALVSVSNPYWTLWWVTIGVKLASDGLAIGPVGVAAFFIGHELADVAWYAAVVTAVHSGRRLLSQRVYRTIIGACAVFLLGLGAWFLLDGLGVIR
jgi:threonine/homoserine/homoserine lactone efflux protein